MEQKITKPLKIISLSGFLILLTGFLIFYFFRKKKKLYHKKLVELEKEANEKYDECYQQVQPLLQLFESNISNKIITNIIPTLTLDENFKIERYANLVKNFELPKTLNENFSINDLLSGEILGNPFILIKSLYNKVVDEVYTGSLTVSWTEYYTDSNGKTQSRIRNETLVASVVRPKQVFENVINLLYGNESAGNLTFSRNPNYIHEMSPRKLNKFLKKNQKLIKKKSTEAIKNGENFTEMANEEFDALFQALNRDNEVDFRLLFTPIGQRNMLNLLKNKNFGDDFSFKKIKKLNNITNDKNWILNIDKSYYKDFSYDKIYEKFFNINTKYFENFYRIFLPILSIPVYHQHKSLDYIYDKTYNFNYNPYTSEFIANMIGQNYFCHIDTVTPAILKTKTIKSEKDIDFIEVNSKSYKTITRTTYVPRTAGNGRTYQVPVNWIEYIPLTTTQNMKIQNLNLTEKEFENSKDKKFIKNLEGEIYTYKNGLLGVKI